MGGAVDVFWEIGGVIKGIVLPSSSRHSTIR
jgi:hypothetical protein